MKFNLNLKKFKSVSLNGDGEVSSDTVFNYHQEEETVWAEYSGGEIKKGTLLGSFISTDMFSFSYVHLNQAGEIKTGNCTTVISKTDSGAILLNETWQWTCGDKSKGTSVLQEVDK